MKPLYILKIGGSVATYKNKLGVSVRKELLEKSAIAIKKARDKKDFNLILIHGAGAAGHQLAHKYNLQDGARNNKQKWKGSFESRLVNQELNKRITEIFVFAGLPITPIHTASVIIQKNKKIFDFNLKTIEESLRWGCIPLLYGEMVFDKNLGMTICSGDVIAPYLAKKMKAKKIFFASDIEGIFDKDPHLHKDAKLIENIQMTDIKKIAQLTGSHNIDTTGGLNGKIKNFQKFNVSDSIEIFNGLRSENFEKVILENYFPHTKLFLKRKTTRRSSSS